MNSRKLLTRTAEFIVLVLVLTILVGQLVGQPVLVSYVETGSMAPTLSPGDGFFVIPAALAGPIESGDVIVFEAKTLHGGGLTTHRVVEETPQGYVTKGDANPFSDQAGDEPPVKQAQIVGVAVQIGGRLVVLPHLGDAVTVARSGLDLTRYALVSVFGPSVVTGRRGLAIILALGGVITYAVSDLLERRSGATEHERDDQRDDLETWQVLALLTALVVAGATASMVVPAGTTEYGVISADNDAPGAKIIPEGESETTNYTVRNGGVIPVVVFLEPASNGVDVRPHEIAVGRHEAKNASITISVPPNNGHFRRYVVERRYLALLPRSVIRGLYHVHPWLPLVVVDAMVAGAFLLFAVPFVGDWRSDGETSKS